jgi:CSLREA domain-containing protein
MKAGQIVLAATLVGSRVGFAAAPATYFVTKTADTADGACDADCSLREAIIAANQAKKPAVVGLPPGVYALTLSGAGEDQSATGDLDVYVDLELRGAGPTRTILDGQQADRLIESFLATQFQLPYRLAISDLTLRNGRVVGAGGGVLVEHGGLALDRVLIESNQAVGVEGVGGGVYAIPLRARGSAFVGNRSELEGGGLFAAGTELRNVTVSGNSAGGIFGGGGVFLALADDDLLLNVTITDNENGGLQTFGETCPSDPTCPPHTSIANSIVAGNDTTDCQGDIESAGHNLFGMVGCPTTLGDLKGKPGLPLDALLSPLEYGGLSTPVHRLLPGSPAIDHGALAGDPAALPCAVGDQRGVARPVDGDGDGVPRCDIGAVEETAGCVPGPATFCARDARFSVRARWRTPDRDGDGQAVPLTSESGYFWFFSPENVELLVKILDGCELNGRYWVFSTGLTDVGVELEVTDTRTGVSRTYSSPTGAPFAPRFDTDAFSTCP